MRLTVREDDGARSRGIELPDAGTSWVSAGRTNVLLAVAGRRADVRQRPPRRGRPDVAARRTRDADRPTAGAPAVLRDVGPAWRRVCAARGGFRRGRRDARGRGRARPRPGRRGPDEPGPGRRRATCVDRRRSARPDRGDERGYGGRHRRLGIAGIRARADRGAARGDVRRCGDRGGVARRGHARRDPVDDVMAGRGTRGRQDRSSGRCRAADGARARRRRRATRGRVGRRGGHADRHHRARRRIGSGRGWRRSTSARRTRRPWPGFAEATFETPDMPRPGARPGLRAQVCRGRRAPQLRR